MSWIEAWKEKRTPWDAGGPAPSLVQLVEADALPSGRALVPGAGSGYDVLQLAGADRRAVGLDLAADAVERFEGLRDEAGVSASDARMIVADFFDYQPDEPYDLIWDYTFLCAIEPEMRPRWAERVDELLGPDGELVTLIFPVRDLDNPPTLDEPGEGPPYSLHPEHVRELLAPTFEPVHLEPADASHPDRGGMEWVGRWRRMR